MTKDQGTLGNFVVRALAVLLALVSAALLFLGMTQGGEWLAIGLVLSMTTAIGLAASATSESSSERERYILSAKEGELLRRREMNTGAA